MKALAKVGAETSATAEFSPTIQPPATVEDDEAIAPSPQTSPYSDHRPALIALIGSMTPAGFEEFCSELLARVGVEDVQPTRYSKDGGIDGTGRCGSTDRLSTDSLPSEEIRRFAGARCPRKKYSGFAER